MNFIKNIFGYGTGAQEQKQPQLYNINGRQFQELTLIAEGGYGYIWRALDVQTKKILIIKRQICQSQEIVEQSKREIRLHKSLGKHPNIVECYDGTILVQNGQTLGVTAMEYCEGGTLYDLLFRHKDKRLNERQVLFVLKDLVQGIKYLHSLREPITHRDIKVENILLHDKIFKLCDFGSASTERVDLALLSKLEVSRCEEEFEKNTTMMYRPPEMSDIYQKYEVNEKVDIWMLGCVLYNICYYEHPFQEASKLAIVQADYKIPFSNYSQKLINLLKIMLVPNPKERADIFTIEKIIENYDTIDKQPIPKQISNVQKVPETKSNNIQDEFEDFQECPQVREQQNDQNLLDI